MKDKIMDKKEQPNYYSVLPATVRYNRNLSDFAKILYSEITCLADKKGYCWASNTYFAELYGKNEATISVTIKALSQEGHVTVFIDRKATNIRKIYIGSLEKSKEPHLKNLSSSLEKSKEVHSKNLISSLEKSKDNNKLNNKNDYSNLKVSKKESKSEKIKSYDDVIDDFFEELFEPYWNSEDEEENRFVIDHYPCKKKFAESCGRYLQMRQFTKRTITNAALLDFLQCAWRMAEGLSIYSLIEVIDQSTRSNWIDPFPVKKIKVKDKFTGQIEEITYKG